MHSGHCRKFRAASLLKSAALQCWTVYHELVDRLADRGQQLRSNKQAAAAPWFRLLQLHGSVAQVLCCLWQGDLELPPRTWLASSALLG
jgi:hypothetical protein